MQTAPEYSWKFADTLLVRRQKKGGGIGEDESGGEWAVVAKGDVARFWIGEQKDRLSGGSKFWNELHYACPVAKHSGLNSVPNMSHYFCDLYYIRNKNNSYQ